MRSVFSVNRATNGGALSIEASTLALFTDVNVTRNEALVGGAFYIAAQIEMQGTEVHFINNSASHTREGGGAIFCKVSHYFDALGDANDCV